MGCRGSGGNQGTCISWRNVFVLCEIKTVQREESRGPAEWRSLPYEQNGETVLAKGRLETVTLSLPKYDREAEFIGLKFPYPKGQVRSALAREALFLRATLCSAVWVAEASACLRSSSRKTCTFLPTA